MVETDGSPDPSTVRDESEAETQGPHLGDEASRVVDGIFGNQDNAADDAASRNSAKTSSSSSSIQTKTTVGIPALNGPLPSPTAGNLQTNQRFNTNQRRPIHEVMKIRPFIKQTDRTTLSTRELTQPHENSV